jgi:ribosomal protein L16 Arg81 hydroxylase
MFKFTPNFVLKKLNLEKAIFFKNAFIQPSDFLKDFFRILFNPQLGCQSFKAEQDGPLIKIMNGTKLVDPEAWSHKIEGDQGFYRDFQSLKKAISLKCSIVFDQYYRYSPDVQELVAFVQSQFNCVSGCNVYLSQKGGVAFPIHRDAHNVLVFAISGQKRWRIYNKKQDLTRSYHEVHLDMTDEEIYNSGIDQEIVMDPGDLLYIPIGQYHSVENLLDNSCHLTLSLSFKPALSLIEEALKEIYTTADSLLSEPSYLWLNRKHVVYRNKKPLDKEKLLEEIEGLLGVLKEVVSQESFIEKQNEMEKNKILQFCHRPSDEFIEDLLK